MQRFKVTSYPTSVEPVSLDLVKAQLRITNTADDVYLTALIKEAREMLELYTGRAIIAQNITESLDIEAFPEPYWNGVRQGSILMFTPAPITLLNPPIVSITQMRTYDINNASAIYPSTSYRLDNSDPLQFSRLTFNYGAVWPSLLRRNNSVEIDYLAGWADGTVPAGISAAIRAIVVYCYSNRAPCSESCVSACGAASALRSYMMARASI